MPQLSSDTLKAIFNREDWQHRAACNDTDPTIFHLADGIGRYRRNRANIKAAKQICATCPVIGECADFAQRTQDRHAILAGLTPAERHDSRRRARSA